jgi:hypothetical protein
MNYINPVEYSKKIMSLMEDETAVSEDTVNVKGEMTMKERISKLTPDEKTKLQEYVDAIKEIKKEIHELLHKDQVEESGGNMSSGLYLNPEE